MIMKKKNQGYYCRKCKSSFLHIQNVPKECLKGDCKLERGGRLK